MGIFEQSNCITLQMRGIEFGHLDRHSRYEQVIKVLHSSKASLSFPELFKNQHQLKGFYRLINNKAVTHSTFISGYQSGLVQYSREQDNQVPWILVQDTMLTDYNSRNLDLGYTQTEKSNGFLLHHGLLLDEKYYPLGLLHQQVIHREPDRPAPIAVAAEQVRIRLGRRVTDGESIAVEPILVRMLGMIA